MANNSQCIDLMATEGLYLSHCSSQVYLSTSLISIRGDKKQKKQEEMFYSPHDSDVMWNAAREALWELIDLKTN